MTLGATPEVVEVRGTLTGAKDVARSLFGEAPSAYEQALRLFRAVAPSGASAERFLPSDALVWAFPKTTKKPWLAVEVSGGVWVEAQLEAPLQGQTLAPLQLSELSKLEGTVFNPSALPVGGALVWLETTESPLPVPWRPAIRSTTTTADGRFELRFFEGERALLHILATGYLPARFDVRGNAPPARFELARGEKTGVLQVLTDALEPAPNVLVTLTDGSPLGLTDSAGRFAYMLEPTARLVLSTASQPGWEIEPRKGETRTFLGGRVLVAGKVVDTNNENIAGAVIEARPLSAPLAAVASVASVARADGFWTIGPLTLMDWELLIRAPGHADHNEALLRAAFIAVDAKLDLGKIRLADEAKVSGWVSSAGGPVEGAGIYLLRGTALEQYVPSIDPPATPVATFSAADGSFTLRGLKHEESFSLEVRAAGFEPYRLENLLVGTSDSLDLTLSEASSLTAIVRLMDTPAPAASVFLEIETDDGKGYVLYGHRSTDERGEATFQDLPRGRVRIVAEKHDLRTAERTLELLASEENVDLELGSGVTVEALVVDADGFRLPAAQAGLLAKGSDWNTSPEPDGFFRWYGLAAGKVEILASAEGFEARRVTVVVPEEGPSQTEIRLTPLRNELRGILVSETGKPVGDATVVLRREWSDQPGGPVFSTATTARTAADGSFRFERLALETYQLHAKKGLRSTQIPIVVDRALTLVEVVLREVPDLN